jgi:nucleoid DNA-binding protein
MTAALASGEVIELRGLGTLEVRERWECVRRNLNTGEAVIVPPHRHAVFRPGSRLKTTFVNILNKVNMD